MSDKTVEIPADEMERLIAIGDEVLAKLDVVDAALERLAQPIPRGAEGEIEAGPDGLRVTR